MPEQATELEVNMNAVERMVEYTSQPTEGSAQALTQNPPQGWPHAGAITIDNLQVSLSNTHHMLAHLTMLAGNLFLLKSFLKLP